MSTVEEKEPVDRSAPYMVLFIVSLLFLFFFLCVVGATPRATLQFSARFRKPSKYCRGSVQLW